MAFQYIMPTPVDMSDVFAPLMHARQVNKDREAKRAELLLRKEVADRENARLDEQIRHTRTLEERQQGIDVAETIPKLRSMLTPGSSDYDPESAMSMARARGINLSAQQPQMPTAPEKRDIGPTQLEYGPRATPEIAQQAAILSARTPPDQPEKRADEVMDLAGQAEAERKRFEQANDPSVVAQNQQLQGQQDAEQNDYRAKLAEASRRSPTYTGTSPIGPVSIDPNAAQAARAEALRQQQEKLAPLTGAVDKEFQPVVEAMVKAGMPGSEIAKAVADYRKQTEEYRRKSEFETTATEKVRHNKAMEAVGFAGARSREGAQRDKNSEKADETTVRDENGNPIGYVPTGKGGAQGFATRDADYGRGEQMLQSLLNDVEKNGDRVMTPEAIQRRATLHKNAIIGVATVSPLGKTDEAQKLESASIGPSGAPSLEDKSSIFIGANPEAIRRKLDELRTQRQRYRAQTLIPLDQRPGTGAAPRGPSPRKSNPIIDARHRPSLDDLAEEHGL